MRETIRVLTGPSKGEEFELADSLTIGRKPDNGVCLQDALVSRYHAIVERSPVGTMLRDAGSANGTYVDSRRVVHCELAHGDVIHIGQTELRYEMDPPPQAAPLLAAGKSDAVRQSAAAMEVLDTRDFYASYVHPPAETVSINLLWDMQNRLAAAYEAIRIIGHETDLGQLLGRVGGWILPSDSPHGSAVLVRDEKTGQLAVKHIDTASGSPLTVNGPLMDRAMRNAESVVARLKAHESTHFGVAADAVCVPLIHRGDALGVLYIEADPPTETFTSDKLELVTALAGPIAIAVKNAQVLERLEQSYEQTLFGLASAIELRDHYTVGHTLRVTQFALAMAREMGWPEDKLKQCERGGILHDIGKIAVDDAILSKAGPLTEEERKKMRVHPERGARILQDIEFLADVIPYVLYHHERYDGSTDEPDPGYPYGLAGEDIPIEGRLMGVADAFDALTSNRPYKKASEPEEAIAILREDRGTRLDPVCVRALTRCFLAGRIHPILQDYRKADAKSISCPFCSTFIRIPERAGQGIEWDCGICHRRIRLLQHGNAWRGELVSGASLGSQHSR